MLEDSPGSVIASMDAHVALAKALEANNQPALAKEVLAQAGRDLPVLRRPPLTPRPLWSCLSYLDCMGAHKEALELARTACQRADAPFMCRMQFSLRLCLEGHEKEARDALGRSAPPGSELYYHIQRALLFWDTPGGAAGARKEYKRLARLPRSDTMIDFYPQMILRTLGGKDLAEAQKVCESLQPRTARWPPGRRNWYVKLLDYNAGRLSAKELVDVAGGSRWNRCEGHYFIGLTLLGEGDRERARGHFELAVATRCYQFNEHIWSRMLLARMRAKAP
jgi:hypothetical protein